MHTLPLQPGSYAFGRPAVIQIRGRGHSTHIWVGLRESSGHPALCLGVLSDPRKLIAELTARLKTTPPPRTPPSVGRAGEAVKERY